MPSLGQPLGGYVQGVPHMSFALTSDLLLTFVDRALLRSSVPICTD